MTTYDQYKRVTMKQTCPYFRKLGPEFLKQKHIFAFFVLASFCCLYNSITFLSQCSLISSILHVSFLEPRVYRH